MLPLRVTKLFLRNQWNKIEILKNRNFWVSEKKKLEKTHIPERYLGAGKQAILSQNTSHRHFKISRNQREKMK